MKHIVLISILLIFIGCSVKNNPERNIKLNSCETKKCEKVNIIKTNYICEGEDNKKYVLQVRTKSNWGKEYIKAFTFIQMEEEGLKNCKITKKPF